MKGEMRRASEVRSGMEQHRFGRGQSRVSRLSLGLSLWISSPLLLTWSYFSRQCRVMEITKLQSLLGSSSAPSRLSKSAPENTLSSRGSAEPALRRQNQSALDGRCVPLRLRLTRGDAGLCDHGPGTASSGHPPRSMPIPLPARAARAVSRPRAGRAELVAGDYATRTTATTSPRRPAFGSRRTWPPAWAARPTTSWRTTRALPAEPLAATTRPRMAWQRDPGREQGTCRRR